MPTKRGSRVHPSPTSRTEPELGTPRLLEAQHVATSSSGLFPPGRGSRGLPRGAAWQRAAPDAALGAAFPGEPASPCGGSCLAVPCRAGSCRSTLLGRGSAAGSPALGPCLALHGSMRWVWVARGPCVLPAAACRVCRSRTAGTQQRRQTASKHQDFCFPFTAVVPHSFAFFAKGLPLLCVKALNS